MQRGTVRDALVSGGFWMAWLLLATAALLPVPLLGFCLAFLAVTCSIAPLAFGSVRLRVGAAVSLLLGLLLAFSLVGKAQRDPWFKKHRPTSTAVFLLSTVRSL